MKASFPEKGRATAELRMLWYPHVSGSELTPELIDSALRNGRRERALMLTHLATFAGHVLGRWAAAVLAGLGEMQRRRAGVTLARVRPAAAVVAMGNAACGESRGPVGEILTSPQRATPAHPAGVCREAPRLAA